MQDRATKRKEEYAIRSARQRQGRLVVLWTESLRRCPGWQIPLGQYTGRAQAVNQMLRAVSAASLRHDEASTACWGLVDAENRCEGPPRTLTCAGAEGGVPMYPDARSKSWGIAEAIIRDERACLSAPSANFPGKYRRSPGFPSPDADQKKFYCRPVAPTFFRNEPFGENVEGLSHCGDKGWGSRIMFKRRGP